MSELKAFNMPQYAGKFTMHEVYLKSEADKVIAELKKQARHHKYKRCLAMARIAQDDWHLHNSFYAMGHQEFEKRKCEFYEKWRKRWLELAEEPTWAKFLQLIHKETK